MSTAYLSLGSNLEDRAANLTVALKLLQALGPVQASSFYETAPRDFLDQPAFLNCAASLVTTASPEDVLAHIREVEAALGRQRNIPKGPRLIDVDILLFDDLVRQDNDLTIPHPRMYERRFVLEPLLEIAPALRDPRTGKPLRDFLPAVMDQAVTRVTG